MPDQNVFSRLISFIRRKTSQKYRFNRQFEQGKWNSMQDAADSGRYTFIVEYIRHNARHARILDLGCGEGILLERFQPSDYAGYLGVDFSEVAIANAKKLENDRTKFVVGDLNKLSVNDTFDVIIYNESLYYMKSPKTAVRELFSQLSPNGIFIFSMVDKHGKERSDIWSALDEIVNTIEKKKIANGAGDSWTVKVCRVKRKL